MSLPLANDFPEDMDKNWPVLLFSKSVLKQNKFKEIATLLGQTEGLHCLDIGGDNGVISYLLRQRGGKWKSADLDESSVHSIRELVKTDVYQIDGRPTLFRDNEFDRVVIVDFLEHIPSDGEFLKELFRILKPGGILIINVPYIKNTLLRRLRLALGQTDEKHGHLRPGYTVKSLSLVLGDRFRVEGYKTYSKFFSELIDTLMASAFSLLKRGQATSQKGTIVTGQDMSQHKRLFTFYSLIYPMVWLFTSLDLLLHFQSGYMLILTATVNKKKYSGLEEPDRVFRG